MLRWLPGDWSVCEVGDRPSICERSVCLKQTVWGVRLQESAAQQLPSLSLSGKLWVNLFSSVCFHTYNMERKLPPPEFVVSFEQITLCKHLEKFSAPSGHCPEYFDHLCCGRTQGHGMTKFWSSCKPSSKAPAILCLTEGLLPNGHAQDLPEPSALGTGWLSPGEDGGGGGGQSLPGPGI